MKIRPIIFLLATLFFSQSIEAADFGGGVMAVKASSLNGGVSAIYGQACEAIKKGELKSSVRMRATDKASFSAVRDLSSLSDFKKNVSEHDFNVMIYNIVDSYVEDLAVRTIKQNNQEICVEVTGSVPRDDIRIAVEDVLDEVEKQKLIVAGTELRSDEKKASATSASKIAAGEQVQRKSGLESAENPINEMLISPAISERQTAVIEPIGKPVYAPQPQPTTQALMQTKTVPDEQDERPLVYIAPVEFFNNTYSSSHTEILRKLFDHNTYFYLTDKKELADFVVIPKVLRAKIDPINNNTNRLQMVVSVGAEFVNDKSSLIEHQNRFILFSTTDDEQETASKLMRKLLRKAAEPILSKIEFETRRSGSNPQANQMLTPGS